MPTLKEQQTQLVEAQHKLAIWKMLHEYLDTTYVPQEGGHPAKAIRVKDCLVPVVGEDTIEEVLSSISQGPIAEFDAKIEEIESAEVVIIEKGDIDG